MCRRVRLVIAVWVKHAVRVLATDLDEQEWTHYRHTEPVNADDVLRVVQMLKSYDGDFTDVLEDPILGEIE